MKQVNLRIPFRILSLLLGLFLSVSAYAQQVTVNGHVEDAAGEPIIGATVRVQGQTGGVVTDYDGNFTTQAPSGATLEISYIGYQTATVTASSNVVVTLQEDSEVLNEVVVIGYGVVKKTDLTGAVTALKPDSKNKGLVVTPQEMMSGKIAGVNVTSDGGTPGGSSTIRIRGGSSLSASNNPLIVIDGVPMDNNGVKGLANPLAMVNPQDIESFNVLKSASATAIYGSRGSNGVIIITTKKGRRGSTPSVSYAGNVNVSMKKKTIDVMNGDEYREFIDRIFQGASNHDEAVGLLGTANTDWQEEIYRTAVSHDHNVTVSGAAGLLPYRVSLGYTDQQGILKTSDFQRYTAAVTLNPSLFDDHLNITLNAKGLWAKSQYADGSAINSAVAYDPSQSVYDPSATNFGGYFQWQSSSAALNDSSWPYTYNNLATKNPVAILELKDDRAISRTFIGSAEFDYKIHGFEDLRLHATFGADISKGKQWTDVDPRNALSIYYGSHGWETIMKRNLTLSMYAQYYHDFNDKAKNHFDIMGGYEWAHYWRTLHNNYWSLYPETNNDKSLAGTKRGESFYDYKTENYLVSFFGRANWSLMDRYYLTVTVRDDGSSRFKDHWSIFPAVAFAWKINDENKFREIEWLSDLKLRLDWGMTGQQEGIGDYNYFPVYSVNTGVQGSFYDIIGDGTFVRPKEYDPNLKWETTTTYNIGLDWGIFDQRLTGTVDWYYRKTTDLLNSAYVAAGSNFRNKVTTNIGHLYNTGVEVALSWKAIQAKDWYWTIDYNFTYNKNRITKLGGGDDPDYKVLTGGISAGTGGTIQAHAVGYPAFSYLVYQQAYDDNGMPIEGQVVDRNGDGQITEDDQYLYKCPMAPVTMGLASRLEYKNWDFGFSLRASIGNYVYNDYMAGNSTLATNNIFYSGYLVNRPTYVLPYNWQTYDVEATHSDRWVQNGSFLKCDNITLGYSFANLFKVGNYHGVSGRIYASATNVFCITKYKGIDPEVFGGIDNGVYPRPITFQLGLNLNF
ncbi:MAG: TonB-dependent receptor [Prevotella sp.]|nr:TonB-dependent receptor [Prevotella sp.]